MRRLFTTKQMTGCAPASTLVAVAVIAATLATNATSVLQLAQSGTTAWLASESVGAVGLYDGALPEQPPLSFAEVVSPNTEMTVLQDDGGAIVFDDAHGTVTRIDGATRAFAPLSAVFSDDDGEPLNVDGARVVDGTESVWVLSASEGQRIDRDSLSRVGEPVELPGDSLGDAIVDGTGGLWFVSGSSLFNDDEGSAVETFDGTVRLGSVDDRPVVLADDMIEFIDAGTQCELAVGDGAAVHRTNARALVTDPASGRAIFVDRDCSVSEVAGLATDAEIGDVVQADGWVYLAETMSQRVWIINADNPGANNWTPELAADGEGIGLVGAGDRVFFNQASTNVAGVLQPSGELVAIEKTATGDDGRVGGDEGDDGQGGSGGEGDSDSGDSDDSDDRQRTEENADDSARPPDGQDRIEQENDLVDTSAKFQCVGPSEVIIGAAATMTAVRGDGSPVQEASWTIDGEAAGNGSTVALPTATAGRLDVRYEVEGETVRCATVTVDEASSFALEADIYAPDGEIAAGATITFIDRSKGLPDTWSWSVEGSGAEIVGDANRASVRVRFADVGSAVLTLDVSRSSDNASDQAVKAVNVVSPEEKPFDLVLNCPATVGVNRSFSMSAAPEGRIEEIQWTIPTGDDRPDHVKNGLTFLNWSLTRPGQFTVRATATSVEGDESSAACSVTAEHILSPTIEAQSAAEPGEELTFVVRYDADVGDVSVAWDFGDGSTARGQSVSHTFEDAGRYLVTATLSASGVKTATATVSVLVGGVSVPDTVGLNEDSAGNELRAVSLLPRSVQACSVDDDVGQVIRQDPVSGAAVEKGAEVLLYVAAPPETVPDLSSSNANSTDSQLLPAGSNATIERVKRDSTAPPGTILSQSPAAGSERCGNYILTVEYAGVGGGDLSCPESITFGQELTCERSPGTQISWGDGTTNDSSTHAYATAGTFRLQLLDGEGTVVDSQSVSVIPDLTTTCDDKVFSGSDTCRVTSSTPGVVITVTCVGHLSCDQPPSSSVQITMGSQTLDVTSTVRATATVEGVTAEAEWFVKHTGCG